MTSLCVVSPPAGGCELQPWRTKWHLKGERHKIKIKYEYMQHNGDMPYMYTKLFLLTVDDMYDTPESENDDQSSCFKIIMCNIIHSNSYRFYIIWHLAHDAGHLFPQS